MAALKPYYNMTDWQNLPNMKTPINRKNLYNVEQGIKEADNRLVQIDAQKADLTLVNLMVSDFIIDAKTGIITIFYKNGATKTYDLDIERVVTNFDINDNNELVLVLADGTVKKIDLTRFVYSVESTATISMKIVDRVMTATVVDGSITMKKLDAAIQTEFRQYMLDSQAARDAALQYQSFAKRYVLGDEIAFPGSEIDNGKYYYEQSKLKAEQIAKDTALASEKATIATNQATIATQKSINAAASEINAGASALVAAQKATAAFASEQVAKEKAFEALASKEAANQSEQLAKRYLDGNSEAEYGEDNSTWYYQQTKGYCQESKGQADRAVVEADRAARYASIVAPGFLVDLETMELYIKTGVGVDFKVFDDNILCWQTT